MKKYTHEKAHEEIDYIFKTLLPQRGMAERPEQIRLCHSILDAMLDGSIALCDAGTGIGKTFGLPDRRHPAWQVPGGRG